MPAMAATISGVTALATAGAIEEEVATVARDEGPHGVALIAADTHHAIIAKKAVGGAGLVREPDENLVEKRIGLGETAGIAEGLDAPHAGQEPRHIPALSTPLLKMRDGRAGPMAPVPTGPCRSFLP